MALFNKTASALCMLGSIEVVNAIIESQAFDSYNIELVQRDFATIDELVHGIKEIKKAKYVFISDTALIGIEDGKYEIIKRIREKYPDIMIAMFFNDEKRDETYKNWAFGYKVYNLYYSDSDGGYDFEKIAGELANPQMPLRGEHDEFHNEELEKKEEEIRRKENELAQKAEELKELEQRLVEAEGQEESTENEAQVILLKDQIKKMQTDKINAEENINRIREQFEQEQQELKRRHEKEKEEYFKRVDEGAKAQIEEIKQKLREEQNLSVTSNVKTLGCITIGVFSISPGAGSTYTSVQIGESFAMAGYSTAIVAYDGKKELQYAGGDYAYYVIPEKENKKATLLKTINEGYNFVILDFGCLFPLTPLGKLEIGEGTVSDREDDIGELLRCNYKIAVGHSSPWHIGKLNFFIENEIVDPMTSIFSINGFSEKRELVKCELPMCERDIDVINQILFEWLGISRKQEQDIIKKKGIFKIKERMIGSK